MHVQRYMIFAPGSYQTAKSRSAITPARGGELEQIAHQNVRNSERVARRVQKLRPKNIGIVPQDRMYNIEIVPLLLSSKLGLFINWF